MPALQTTLPNRSSCSRMRRVTSCLGHGRIGQKAGAGAGPSGCPPSLAAIVSAGNGVALAAVVSAGDGVAGFDERAKGHHPQPTISAAKMATRAGRSGEPDRTRCSLRGFVAFVMLAEGASLHGMRGAGAAGHRVVTPMMFTPAGSSGAPPAYLLAMGDHIAHQAVGVGHHGGWGVLVLPVEFGHPDPTCVVVTIADRDLVRRPPRQRHQLREPD